MGNIHQADSRFGDLAGMQCTGIAFTALILAFLSHIPTPSWNSHVVDSLVNEGNQIYLDILLRSETNRNPHYLLHRDCHHRLQLEIMSFVHIYTEICTLEVFLHIIKTWI